MPTSPPAKTIGGADEAPPAYSSAPNAAPIDAAVASGSRDISALADDPYAFLSSFDTIFLIDDSGSMAGSSWTETAKALQAITPICTQHDADGIDIYFLNQRDSAWYHGVKSPTTVHEIFQSVHPRAATPTGQRLIQILKPYLAKYELNPQGTKPINIIVITDGVPSDDVESPLIYAAKKLDRLDAPAWQVGVQFFQVGRDSNAKKHLESLDDELAKISGDPNLRDMVDTVPFIGKGGTTLTGEGILKVVLGACNRRLDRKKSEGVHEKR